jgi:hypothetical protein
MKKSKILTLIPKISMIWIGKNIDKALATSTSKTEKT